jgi:hypothetical protein
MVDDEPAGVLVDDTLTLLVVAYGYSYVLTQPFRDVSCPVGLYGIQRDDQHPATTSYRRQRLDSFAESRIISQYPALYVFQPRGTYTLERIETG